MVEMIAKKIKIYSKGSFDLHEKFLIKIYISKSNERKRTRSMIIKRLFFISFWSIDIRKRRKKFSRARTRPFLLIHIFIKGNAHWQFIFYDDIHKKFCVEAFIMHQSHCCDIVESSVFSHKGEGDKKVWAVQNYDAFYLLAIFFQFISHSAIDIN